MDDFITKQARAVLKAANRLAMDAAGASTSATTSFTFTTEEAAGHVALIQETISVLQVAKKDCENRLIALTSAGKQTLDVGRSSLIIERTSTPRRFEWDHTAAARAVLATARERGQLRNDTDAADLFVEMASITGWKGDPRSGTGLYRLGLDKDQFSKQDRDEKVTVTGKVK